MSNTGPECRLPETCEACGQLIEPADDSPIVAGDLVLRPGFRTVQRGDRQVRVSEQQFRILIMLVKRGSARKEAIYQQVFERLDRDGPEEKIVDVQVCKLRKNLREIGAEGVIKTIWGRGYAFDPDNTSPAVPTPEMRRRAKEERLGRQ